MTYGFKFFNDSSKIIIDDNNVKPWFHSQSQVINVTNVTSTYNNTYINGAFAGYSGSYNNTWNVFRVRYSMPMAYTTFPLITLPNTGSNIWYYLETPYSLANQNGYIDILAYVSSATVSTAADYPQVYAFVVDPIPATAKGTGYGVQLFSGSDSQYGAGQCVFDSTKRHIQVYSYPQIYIPNSLSFVGPGSPYSPNTISSSLLPTNPAFLLPSVNLGFVNSQYTGDNRVVSVPTLFARVNNVIYTANPIGYYNGNVSITNPAFGIFNTGAGGTQPIIVVDSTNLYEGYTFPGLPASYTLTANKTSIQESSSASPDYITFTLTTTGLANGSQVPFTISGTNITSSDFEPQTLTGNFIIQSNQATYQLYARNDGNSESLETATLRLNNNAASINFNITDYVSYSLTIENSVVSIEEGQAFAVRLTTVGLADGTSVPYTISGISLQDTQEASLTGNFIVGSSGTSGIAFKAIKTAQDSSFEGTETITVFLTNQPTTQVSVSLVDLTPFQYDNNIGEYINESASITPSSFTTAQNCTVSIAGGKRYTANGTNYYDTIDWLIVPASYEQSDVIDYYTNNFKSTFTTSTLQLDYDGNYYNPNGQFTAAGSYRIWFRSRYTRHIFYTNTVTVTAAPTYSITSNLGSAPLYVNEGQTITFTLTTTNVANGTQFVPTIINSTVGSADFNNDPGATITINNNQAQFQHQIKSDNLTEGQEQYQLVIDMSMTPPRTRVATFGYIYINDTSLTPAGYNITASPTSVNEGSSTTYTCTASGVAGQTIYWAVGGTVITGSDISSAQIDLNDGNGFQSTGPYSGSVYIPSSPYIFYVRITFAQDQTTEGAENFGFYLKTGSTSGTVVASNETVYIQDTSQYPPNGTPVGNPYCVGTDRYQNYANGSGGTYSQVIEYNSASCGYVTYNEQLSVFNPTYYDSVVATNEAASVVITGAQPSQYADFIITTSTASQPTTYNSTIYINSAGQYANYSATGDAFGGVGTWKLWVRFSNGHVRSATITVVPAYGTPVGGLYCSGYNRMQNYANGRGGTYAGVVQSNSTACGYVQQYYPSLVNNYFYDDSNQGSNPAYFEVTGAYPGGEVRFTITSGPSAVGASTSGSPVYANSSGNASFNYGASLRPYVVDGTYSIAVTFPGQDAYIAAGNRTLTITYIRYTDYTGGGGG